MEEFGGFFLTDVFEEEVRAWSSIYEKTVRIDAILLLLFFDFFFAESWRFCGSIHEGFNHILQKSFNLGCIILSGVLLI